MQRKPKSSARVSRFECLESRTLLAGNVSVAVVGGELDILGDGSGNTIQISQIAGGNWKVQGTGTTINGSTSAFTAIGVTGDIVSDLGAGNNYLKIFNGAAPQNVRLSAQSGTDAYFVSGLNVHNQLSISDTGERNTILIDRLVAGSLSITSGAEADMVTITNSTAADGLTLVDAGGNNSIRFSSVIVTSTGLSITAGGGNDALSIVNTTARGAGLTIDAGSGANSINLNAVAGTHIGIDTGVDADLVMIASSTATSGITIHAGQGNNNVSMRNVDLQSGLGITAGDGKDSVSVNNVTVAGGLDVSVAHGNNSVTLYRTILSSGGAGVSTGTGNDNVAILNCTMVGGLIVADSGGTNTFNVTTNSISGDVGITTVNGRDTISVSRTTIQGNLTIAAGDEKDTVSLFAVDVGSHNITVGVGPGTADTLTVMNCTAGTETFTDTGGVDGSIRGLNNHFATAATVSGFAHRFGV